MRLEDVVSNPGQDIVDGPFGSNLKASEYVAEGIPIARLQNVDRGFFDPKKLQFVTRKKAAELSRHSFQTGDILVTKLGDPLGEACIVPASIPGGIIVADLVRVRPCAEVVDARYLELAINSPHAEREFKLHTKGTTRPRVNLGILRGLAVPLAPRSEQNRIASKIEELYSDLDAGVAALERARANLKRYRAAVLKAAVEGKLTEQWRKAHPDVEPASKLLERILAERRKKWEEVQLARFAAAGKAPPKGWKGKYSEPQEPDTSDLPELPTSWCWATFEQIVAFEPYSLAIGPFGSNLKVGDYRTEGVPLVFVRNIRSGVFGGNATSYISKEKSEELKAHQIGPGDLLVTKMGDPPGDARLYPSDQPKAVITADCIKVRIHRLFPEKRYFEEAVNSDVVQKQIRAVTIGVAQQKVSLERFRGLAVPISPVDEQIEIVTQVEAIFSSIAHTEVEIQRLLKHASRLHQSILKRAFEGKLVPQDPNDEPASVLLERIRVARGEQQPRKRRGRPTKNRKS